MPIGISKKLSVSCRADVYDERSNRIVIDQNPENKATSMHANLQNRKLTGWIFQTAVTTAMVLFLDASLHAQYGHGGSDGRHSGSHSGGHMGSGGGHHHTGGGSGHYGGSHYGGFGASGIGLSFGAGYSSFGYPGLGYSNFGVGPSLGYSNFGVGPSLGYGTFGVGPSLGYSNFGYSNYGYVPRAVYVAPAYNYSSSRAPAVQYQSTTQLVPSYARSGYSSMRPSSALPPVTLNADGTPKGELRPGMVLPDGAIVVSVGQSSPAPAPPASR